MGFLKKIEAILLGAKIIKDYGVIGEYQIGWANCKHSALLIEKDDEKKFIIKESGTAPLAAGVRYLCSINKARKI